MKWKTAGMKDESRPSSKFSVELNTKMRRVMSSQADQRFANWGALNPAHYVIYYLQSHFNNNYLSDTCNEVFIHSRTRSQRLFLLS